MNCVSLLCAEYHVDLSFIFMYIHVFTSCYIVQLKHCQTRYTVLELELSTKTTHSEQEHLQLTTDIRRLQQELQRVQVEEVERVRREGREEMERVRGKMERELEEVRREAGERVEVVSREGEEELVRIRKEGEDTEKMHHHELREAVKRAETEEQK